MTIMRTRAGHAGELSPFGWSWAAHRLPCFPAPLFDQGFGFALWVHVIPSRDAKAWPDAADTFEAVLRDPLARRVTGVHHFPSRAGPSLRECQNDIAAGRATHRAGSSHRIAGSDTPAPGRTGHGGQVRLAAMRGIRASYQAPVEVVPALNEPMSPRCSNGNAVKDRGTAYSYQLVILPWGVVKERRVLTLS